MNKISLGRLGFLPRFKISKRKSIKKLYLVIAWGMLLFGAAGSAFAFYGPEEIGQLLATASPYEAPQPPAKEDKAPAPAQAAPKEEVEKAIPEIKIEIVAEEYIPPVIKPTVSAAIGGGAFPFGQCTYYVASRRKVTWSGNAGQWYSNAQVQGYAVGSAPKAGAIMVSFEGVAAGHVAYVEYVNANGSFVVSEMNYSGNWGKITSRTVVPSTIYIVGFIY